MGDKIGNGWREIIRDMHAAGWRHSVRWIDVGRDADGAPLSEGVLEHTWKRSAESINVYVAPDATLSGYLSYWPDRDRGDPDGVSVSVGHAAASGPDWLRRLMQLCAILPARPAHPEDRCHRCDRANVPWSAPSPLWNAIMRGGSINGDDEFNGIVCPSCFATLAEQRGIATIWRFDAVKVHVPLETMTPSGRVWDEQTWRWLDAVPSIPSESRSTP